MFPTSHAVALLAESPKWTDDLTAIGTVALAIVTVAALVVTVLLARRDRKDAATRLKGEQDRAEADRKEAQQRLREERDESERRIREEREAADHRQLRERQIANASALLHRIADLHPYLDLVPQLGRTSSSRATPMLDRLLERDEAIRSLQRGAETEAHALHDPRAAELYRTYVQLVLSARAGKWAKQLEGVEPEPRAQQQRALEQRISGDLRRFALYVRLWLEALINGEQIPEDVLGPFANSGDPSIPILGNRPEYQALWNPQTVPPCWHEHLQTDARDPQFRPLP